MSEAVNKIVNNEYFQISAALITGAFATRLHFTRYLRKYGISVSMLAIFYRSFVADNSGVPLNEILKRFLFRGNTRAENFFSDLLGLLALYQFFTMSDEILTLNSLSLKNLVMDSVFDMVKYLPFVQKELGKEIGNLESTLQHDLKSKTRAMGQLHTVLPKKGIDPKEILDLMGSFVASEDKVKYSSYRLY